MDTPEDKAADSGPAQKANTPVAMQAAVNDDNRKDGTLATTNNTNIIKNNIINNEDIPKKNAIQQVPNPLAKATCHEKSRDIQGTPDQQQNGDQTQQETCKEIQNMAGSSTQTPSKEKKPPRNDKDCNQKEPTTPPSPTTKKLAASNKHFPNPLLAWATTAANTNTSTDNNTNINNNKQDNKQLAANEQPQNGAPHKSSEQKQGTTNEHPSIVAEDTEPTPPTTTKETMPDGYWPHDGQKTSYPKPNPVQHQGTTTATELEQQDEHKTLQKPNPPLPEKGAAKPPEKEQPGHPPEDQPMDVDSPSPGNSATKPTGDTAVTNDTTPPKKTQLALSRDSQKPNTGKEARVAVDKDTWPQSLTLIQTAMEGWIATTGTAVGQNSNGDDSKAVAVPNTTTTTTGHSCHVIWNKVIKSATPKEKQLQLVLTMSRPDIWQRLPTFLSKTIRKYRTKPCWAFVRLEYSRRRRRHGANGELNSSMTNKQVLEWLDRNPIQDDTDRTFVWNKLEELAWGDKPSFHKAGRGPSESTTTKHAPVAPQPDSVTEDSNETTTTTTVETPVPLPMDQQRIDNSTKATTSASNDAHSKTCQELLSTYEGDDWKQLNYVVAMFLGAPNCRKRLAQLPLDFRNRYFTDSRDICQSEVLRRCQRQGVPQPSEISNWDAQTFVVWLEKYPWSLDEYKYVHTVYNELLPRILKNPKLCNNPVVGNSPSKPGYQDDNKKSVVDNSPSKPGYQDKNAPKAHATQIITHNIIEEAAAATNRPFEKGLASKVPGHQPFTALATVACAAAELENRTKPSTKNREHQASHQQFDQHAARGDPSKTNASRKSVEPWAARIIDEPSDPPGLTAAARVSVITASGRPSKPHPKYNSYICEKPQVKDAPPKKSVRAAPSTAAKKQKKKLSGDNLKKPPPSATPPVIPVRDSKKSVAKTTVRETVAKSTVREKPSKIPAAKAHKTAATTAKKKPVSCITLDDNVAAGLPANRHRSSATTPPHNQSARKIPVSVATLPNPSQRLVEQKKNALMRAAESIVEELMVKAAVSAKLPGVDKPISEFKHIVGAWQDSRISGEERNRELFWDVVYGSFRQSDGPLAVVELALKEVAPLVLSGFHKSDGECGALSLLVIGNRISVYWPGYDRYYDGVVSKQRQGGRRYYIVYDDGDEEWIDVEKEKWRAVDEDPDAIDYRLLVTQAVQRTQHYVEACGKRSHGFMMRKRRRYEGGISPPGNEKRARLTGPDDLVTGGAATGSADDGSKRKHVESDNVASKKPRLGFFHYLKWRSGNTPSSERAALPEGEMDAHSNDYEELTDNPSVAQLAVVPVLRSTDSELPRTPVAIVSSCKSCKKIEREKNEALQVAIAASKRAKSDRARALKATQRVDGMNRTINFLIGLCLLFLILFLFVAFVSLVHGDRLPVVEEASYLPEVKLDRVDDPMRRDEMLQAGSLQG